MIRALAVVTLLAATAHSASAGVYGSLGLGNTGVADDASSGAFTPASRSLRFAAGYEFTKYVGAEGGVIGYNLAHGGADYSGREFYAAGVGHLPIGNGFGAFARLGLQRTSFSTDRAQGDLSGSGYLVGAGFEYQLRIPQLAHASVWVDYTRNAAGLADSNGRAFSRDVGTSMWTLGVTAGL